jgi:hypothetical protein
MALRVAGHMNERATNGRGQLLAANDTRSVEVGRGENANAARGVAEGCFDLREQFVQALPLPFSALLGFERRKLFRRELFTFGVGEAGGPLGQVFVREVERVENGAAGCGNIGVGARSQGSV